MGYVVIEEDLRQREICLTTVIAEKFPPLNASQLERCPWLEDLILCSVDYNLSPASFSNGQADANT